jgi:hypothetical protein
MKKIFFFLLLLLPGTGRRATGQEIREYVVKRTETPLVIDGMMDEQAWAEAATTEYFVEQESGDSVPHPTQARLLWDDHYLYVGFICDDPDVWSTLTGRDAHLWEEENVEIFGDPDGDEKNYFEMEFNPLGTIFDQVVDHSWMEGDNNEDRSWNLQGLKVGVSVAGTVNDVSDTDTAWYCEVAIPYDSLPDSVLSAASRPAGGVSWRLQLARYNRNRDDQGNVTGDPETSLWNMTGNPWFHVPSRFGKIIFSETVTGVKEPRTGTKDVLKWDLYPNPATTTVTLQFSLTRAEQVCIEMLNTSGKVVEAFSSRHYDGGRHRLLWDVSGKVRGVYFLRIIAGRDIQVKKLILVR